MSTTVEKKPSIAYSSERFLRLAISRTGFIFNPATGQSFTVNQTGLMTLDLLRHGTSPEKTATLLAEEYSVPLEVATRSVEAFLSQISQYL